MKTKWNRLLAITAIAVGISAIGLATVAQAGMRLYSGDLRIVGFGNDQTTGTIRPYNTADNYGAYPIGKQLKCNTLPFQPAGTFTLMNHQQGSASTTASFTLPEYGGNPAVITKNGGTVSLPPEYPVDRAAGCTQSKVQAGLPMVVSVPQFKTAATTTAIDPAVPGFVIPAYDFSIQTTGGSFSNYTQYIFGITTADMKNETGVFQKGGGPGSFTIQQIQGQQKQGKIQVTEGANKFGGVMQLMGFFADREGYYRNGHISVADFTWLFDYVGASAQTSLGVVTAGYFKSATAMLVSTSMGQSGTSTIGITGFPWTTGAVEVTATRGPFPTSMKRTGFDARTPGGSGAIQLVSPALSHWDTNGFHNETGSIGVMNLVFTPEPQSWMLLGAGASLLAVLYRSNRRTD